MRNLNLKSQLHQYNLYYTHMQENHKQYFHLKKFSLLNENYVFSLFFYTSLFVYPIITLNTYFQTWSDLSKPTLVNLRLYFKLTKLQVNLESLTPKFNLVSLTPGTIFAKFFDKKALKNRKQTQTLLVRFIRKILIFLNLFDLNLTVRGLPNNLLSFFRLLNAPISYPITNPLQTGGSFLDNGRDFKIRLWLIHFTKTLFFGKLKLKKRGRIKRKVARKIVSNNRLVD